MKKPRSERVAKALRRQGKPGRVPHGEVAAGSKGRTVRLPDGAWKELDALAKELKTTPHELMRLAIVALLREAPDRRRGLAELSKALEMFRCITF